MERRGSTMTMKLLDDVKFLNGLELIKFHKMQSYAEIYQGKITEIKGNLLSLSEVVNISAKMRNEIKIKIRIDTKLIQLFPEEEEKFLFPFQLLQTILVVVELVLCQKPI